jgi:hypothetical protein
MSSRRRRAMSERCSCESELCASAEADDRFAKRAFSVIQTIWAPRPAYCALAAMHGRKPLGC